MKRILVLTAAMVFIIGAAAALAQPGPGMDEGDVGGPAGSGMMPGMMPGTMGPGHGGCNMLDCPELNLTDEQKSKIRELMFAHQQEMIDLKAGLEKAQLNMRHEMNAESPDKAEVLAAAREVNAARGKMAEAKINHRFAMREILTADQLKKWRDCQGSCGGHRGMGMHRGSGHGMGTGMGNMDRRRDGGCVKRK